ncbi:MAG: hypothetical protein AAGC53_15065 [Actinomycetota bacterium]
MTNPVATTPAIREALASVHTQLRRSGTWWDADQIGAIARRARDAFAVRTAVPWLRDLPTAIDGLPAAAIDVIDRVATDPGTIDRPWAKTHIDVLGDAPYVELVGIAAVAIMVHVYAECAGETVEPLGLPSADAGEPSRKRPSGMGDIGAHVPMLEPFGYANVARALSLVPSANLAFYTLVRPMYSEAGFEHLVWETPLSRPQVELVASRVASLNECFY